MSVVSALEGRMKMIFFASELKMKIGQCLVRYREDEENKKKVERILYFSFRA